MAAKMYSTPGVYIEEKDAFSRSVVPVATAVPCFVGCTKFAIRDNESVKGVLVKVKSLGEYERFFGGAPSTKFKVKLKGNEIGVSPKEEHYYLYNSLKAYFSNGGGDCYIFSIGGYDSTPTADDFKSVLGPLENEPEPTLIVMPDAHLIEKSADYYSIWQEVLPHCKKMINRFAILDIHNDGNFADVSNPDKANAMLGAFKNGIGMNELAYGAVYWPWVQTTVVSPRVISYKNVSNWDSEVKNQVKADFIRSVEEMSELEFQKHFGPELEIPINALAAPVIDDATKIAVTVNAVKLLGGGNEETSIEILKDSKLLTIEDAAGKNKLEDVQASIKIAELKPRTFSKRFSTTEKAEKPFKEYYTALVELDDFLKTNEWTYANNAFADKDGIAIESGDLFEQGKGLTTALTTTLTSLSGLGDNVKIEPNLEEGQQHGAMMQLSPLYKAIMNKVRDTANIMPASAAMAGIYKYVDSDRGTHQAPANVSVSAVAKPLLTINNKGQESLNVPIDGKAINVIRSFPGKGTLVWGARTMDGNSQDWRYISVRRTVSMIELSVKYAAEAYVFEPNNASTWSNIQSMISNFLTNMWQGGALAGTTPGEAFSVSVGLGSTMSSVDILDGYMRIMVKVAVTRPAEFIVITFQQQMQTS